MPRIAPVPWEDLDAASRASIERGMATGMYPEPLSMQVVANSPLALAAMHNAYRAVFGKSALGMGLQEKLRIRSAQINGCDMCAAARKDPAQAAMPCDLITGDTPREVAALSLLDAMAKDHHAIDDATVRLLANHFSAEEIVELGWFCGNCIGTHRFMHMLDMMGNETPIVAARQPARAPAVSVA